MLETSPETAPPPASLLDYLRLFRAPNVFTAIADVLMGFAFVQQSFQPYGPLLLLVVASCFLYTAGMVLNDVFDFEIDLAERPQRPLPSGRIPLAKARAIGFGMLASGVACAWVAGFLPEVDRSVAWRSGVVATLLAGAVLAYDGFLKRTPLGPVGMGACRFLNVLLGMSLGGATLGGVSLLGYGPHHLAAAGGIGVYIVGVTWFARNEAAESSRATLLASVAVMLAGIGLLASFCWWWPEPRAFYLDRDGAWLLLIGLFTLPILRRTLTAVFSPTPANVQAAVKHCIFSLIFLDAAAALQASQPIFAVIIILLLLPTMTLGRWVYST
ncbi:MAG: UbiA family prenyltransferase [Planctomycetales bacterium]|nr:UbiA family prenyltransferase [Planctomycetales bacterium]